MRILEMLVEILIIGLIITFIIVNIYLYNKSIWEIQQANIELEQRGY